MTHLAGTTVAILATDGFEQSELFEPRQQLSNAGVNIVTVSLEAGEIKGWDQDNWGRAVPVDATIDSVSVDDFDALVLPGGQINPDVLRTDQAAVDFIKAFDDAGKPVAAICHAPWLLAEAGIAKGRDLTSYHSIKTDMINAGARWHDEMVVQDENLITSRNPGDLDAFCGRLIDVLASKKADRSAA
ncbi:MAG: type 1 glutamine amidotransferase domain-containing protein [Pseudomonadota bacterium]